VLGLGIFRFVPESLYYVPNPHVSMEGPLNLDPLRTSQGVQGVYDRGLGLRA
jgi:hypothetical protein